MAIVPNGDVRLNTIIDKAPAIIPLLRKFTNKFGDQKFPCALIIRKDAPVSIASLEAVIHFRNIFALSCLLFAWPRTIGQLNVFYPLWSDFFNFYPVSLTAAENFLHTLSPATDEAILSNNFRGQTSPNLPSPSHVRFQIDKIILQPLLELWQKGFDSPDWKTHALFRSLAMAYQASSIPANSRYTIFDFGSRIALWVSAFEVLVHPGGKGKANLEKVIEHLQQYAWRKKQLKNLDYQVKINGKTVSVNLIQKLYEELYDARNDFLHGNPVDDSRLFSFRDKQTPSLI